ncbi:MAG: sulfatase [Planctomycetota bacterium]
MISLTAILLAASGLVVTPDRPNVVVLLVDDLGWTDLGCYDSAFYETPHIDGLAAGGMRFTQAYAAAPVCSPTRAALMTGKAPARLDTTDYFGAPQPADFRSGRGRWSQTPLIGAPYVDALPKAEVTLPEALGEAGYRTGFFGKWHLGDEGFWPTDQGFAVNVAGCRWGHPNKGYFAPYGNPNLEDGPEGEYLTDRLAEEAVTFIEQTEEKQPFLLYLAFYTVHTPLQAPEDRVATFREKKQRLGLSAEWGEEPPRKVRRNQEHAVYAAMVASLDRAVGRVLDALEASGRAEDTIVILTSDNGGLSTSEGHPTANVPLRAGKGWLYEGGLRVPLIVRWPGHVRPGSVSSVPVISQDLYPTLLEATGLDAKPEQHLDGESLASVLKEEAPLSRDTLYWHYPHYGNQGGTPGSAIRVGPYKLIELFEDGRLELYDLVQDLGERENLAELQPERVQAMKQKLDAWKKQVDAKPTSRRTE